MTKYKNKYRIESNRLSGWDYGNSGMYFITICTINRDCFFGEIRNGKMILSEIGKIVATEWLKTFEMRPDMNLEMGEYIVMPNHFHAIINIGINEYNTQRDTQRDTQRRDAMHCASTTNASPTNASPTNASPTNASPTNASPTNVSYKNKFGPQSKNLSSVIRGFKMGVTVNARKINPDFGWQTNYHDHIIRNDKSYQNISNYILENPLKWQEDLFNPKKNHSEQ